MGGAKIHLKPQHPYLFWDLRRIYSINDILYTTQYTHISSVHCLVGGVAQAGSPGLAAASNRPSGWIARIGHSSIPFNGKYGQHKSPTF